MLDINKVVTLDNGEKYLILDKTLYNDVMYYYIALCNKTETDIENNFKLVTVEETDGDMVIVEVTGEDRLREILPRFVNEIQVLKSYSKREQFFLIMNKRNI